MRQGAIDSLASDYLAWALRFRVAIIPDVLCRDSDMRRLTLDGIMATSPALGRELDDLEDSDLIAVFRAAQFARALGSAV